MTASTDSARLLAFYRGEGTDDRGRMLDDVHAFDTRELEYHHDYIQWLFPLLERSRAQPAAPVLDLETAGRFRDDVHARDALRRSFRMMLTFYGFHLESDLERPSIVRAPDFDKRQREWLTPHTHNFLRITRILTALGLLGEPALARAFFAALSDLYSERADTIGAETFAYWERALGS